jgi:hypothetical protein
VYVIRPGKWNQLKSAKKKLIAKRGGGDALVATITLLSAQGKAAMQQRPNKPANKGKWDNWVEDSVKWMIQHEWQTTEEAVGLSAKELSTAQQHEVSKDTTLVLNLGEGWRSVARGMEEVFPGGEGGRSGQTRVHLGGGDSRQDHCGAETRLVNNEHGPDHNVVEKGRAECEGVEHDSTRARTHIVQHGQCDEHARRHGPRAVGPKTTEYSKCNPTR